MAVPFHEWPVESGADRSRSREDNLASLDLITIGRSSVDLYGAQVGGRLEDMASFNKYIGWLPDQYRGGHCAARFEVGADHPRRR